jgi:hypothetical protein
MSYKMISPVGHGKRQEPTSSGKKAIDYNAVTTASINLSSNMTERKPDGSKNNSPMKSLGGRPGSSSALANGGSVKNSSAKKKRT